jgi:hypothetical protein
MRTKKAFLCLALVAMVLLSASTVLASTPLSVVIAGSFVAGTDGAQGIWDLQHTASVSIVPGVGGSSIALNGELICKNGDVNTSTGKCNSGVYWMVYQLTSAPANSKLTFSNLSGFTFNAASSPPTFGLLQCGNGITLARCMNNPLSSSLGVTADSTSNSNLSINVPVSPAQAGFAISFYIQVTNTGVAAMASATATSSPMPTQANINVLPHLVSGSGYVTKVTVINTSGTTANGQVNFIDQSGNLVTSSNFSLNPGAAFRVQTNETDRYVTPGTTNWVAVGSDQPVGINLFFEFIPQGTTAHNVINSVGFSPAPLLADFTIPIEVQPKPSDASIGRTVGVAISNPNGVAVTVTVKVVDTNGVTKGITTILIPAYGQNTFDLQSLAAFQGLFTGDFIGSLIISGRDSNGAPLNLSAIALEDDFGPFSATPILPGKAF